MTLKEILVSEGGTGRGIVYRLNTPEIRHCTQKKYCN